MHRAVLLLVLVAAAAMAPPAQPGRLSAVNPWLSACDLSDTDEPYGQHERVCGDIPARERARLLSTTYLRHCRERSLMSALSEGARSDVIGGGVACLKALADLKNVDDIAARASLDLDSILARYDCGQTFSVIHKCSDCQESYRRWVCSSLLPLFVSGAVLGQGAPQGGSGGRGARSAAPPPRQQPPPPSPPRKRSTTRDNYKLYASNNKNTKLKTNSDSYPNNYKNIINDNENLIIKNNNNNIDNYDNILVNDNLYRNSDYDSVYNTILLDSVSGDDSDDAEFMLVDEETLSYYTSHSDTKHSYSNNYRDEGGDAIVYSNASVSRARTASGNATLITSARVTEQPWNERGHTRSEQRAVDARKDLDNRLGRGSAAVNESSESQRRKRRRRNTISAETGRYRLRPCLAVCQDVERTCPYFLPGDRAPSYPTQYAGEPTFLCLDPNIEETGEQLRKSNYGDVDCCYVYCGASGDEICPRCRPNVRLPTQDQPYAPQCSAASSVVTTTTANTTTSSQQTRTTSPNLVIVFFGLSVSCAHFLVTNNLIVIIKKQSDVLINNIKDILISYCQTNYDFIKNIVWKCMRLMRIVECIRL